MVRRTKRLWTDEEKELSLKVGDGEIGWHIKALLARRRSLREKDMPHDEGYGCRVSHGLDGFSPDPLSDLLRQGARELIAQAVEAELNVFLTTHADQTDGAGRRRLVRHGHLPEREVQTGIGAVPVKVPRLRE